MVYKKHFAEVLNLLPAGTYVSGKTIRQQLNHGRWWWQRWSGPGFYTLMAKMEDAGLVWGSYRSVFIDGEWSRQREYLKKS